MNVVVSFLADAALSDGCVGHTAALVRAFEKTGCTVSVVCLSGNGANHVGGRLAYAGPVSVMGMFAAAWRSVAVARQRRADLLVCTSLGAPFNPFVAYAASVLLRIPVLYDCQDPPVEAVPLVFGDSLSAKLLHAWVAVADRLLRASVTWAFCVSGGVERILRRRGWAMPIYRFYNNHGVDEVPSAQTGSGLRSRLGWTDAVVLIYAGGLQPRIRGIELQLEAVALARQRGKNVKFVAFGSGDPAPFIRLARSLEIEDDIRFEAPIPRTQLMGELRAADVAVMSTLPFALPSKMFEYAACGLHVVCNRDNRDIIEAFAPYVLPFDGSARSLAERLLSLDPQSRIPADSEFLERFSRENRASVETVCDQLRTNGNRTQSKSAASVP